MDGVFIARGQDRPVGKKIEPVYLFDLTSTVLYLSHVPIPGDFDGRVIHEIFPDSYLKSFPVKRSEEDSVGDEREKSAFSGEESEIIAERLRGLGYID
jgi:arylsulfatase A-like enzyme